MTAGQPEQPGSGSEGVVDAILAYLNDQDLLTPQDVRAALQREVDAAGPAAVLALKARLAEDNGWGYYAPDPLARRVHHLLADRFLDPRSALHQGEYLAAVGNAPVVLVANHVSYADANVVESLLFSAGHEAVASRLTALAGPKVFTSRERRFSSLCFGTVKVPQSTEVASGEAMLGGREVARAARQSIDAALARLTGGDALLLFGEGTRSRTGQMQPMLTGVARYLQVPGTVVLPVGLTGSASLFPVEAASPRPARVEMTVGPPLDAGMLTTRAGGDRRVVMDAVGLAIARLLPPESRGAYGDDEPLAAARAVLREFGPM